jgi:hypothetical protein
MNVHSILVRSSTGIREAFPVPSTVKVTPVNPTAFAPAVS